MIKTKLCNVYMYNFIYHTQSLTNITFENLKIIRLSLKTIYILFILHFSPPISNILLTKYEEGTIISFFISDSTISK